ncbi:MAG: DUF2905 domain-containing protein [Verrucomicrobiaceae bacterium]|nr:DUF2905 domain-containing protein [Verrucomicrobiaceae bacterium]
MPLGKLILILGLVITAIGAALTWAPWLLSWFGKLPGDIRIEKEGSGFYFPVVSMILISIVLSILMNLLFRR